MNNLNTRLESKYFRSKRIWKQITVDEVIMNRQKTVRIQTQKVNLALLKHLREFKSEKILIRDIDSKFCHDFTEYLTNEKKLKNSSAITYLQKLHAVLQEAVYLNHIARNPMPPISRLLPKHIKIERASLTVEEIRRMEKTKCRHELTKLAFLFSCYTGLRLSDIETLKWENIQKHNNIHMLIKIQVKTNHEVRIPLGKQALNIINYIKQNNMSKGENVFPLYSRTSVYSDLREWAKDAKINKHITFHISRITFVTLSISGGVNLYVISKLCGHKDIKTTQIYARIIDRTYVDAINSFENIFRKNRKQNKKAQKDVYRL